MAAPIKPQKTLANGKDSYWLVPAIANLAAPTAVEVNAATALNISCFLLGDQEGLGGSTDRVTLPSLLCETSTEEALGTTTYSFPDLQVVFNPQAAANSDAKKAFEKIRNGYSGYLVRRQGVTAVDNAAVAAGEFVDVAAIEIGKAIPTKTSTGADAIYTAVAPTSVKGKPEFNVPVV